MNCRSLCDIKKEICAEEALTASGVTTLVTFTIDAYGNLDITDPSAEFTAALDASGNLAGSGSQIDRFYFDPYKNMQFNNN